jgi:soluble lytic murein transglycosylase-like protein
MKLILRRSACTLFMAIVMGLPLQASAHADVIEIADDGSVLVRTPDAGAKESLPTVPEAAVTPIASVAVPQRFASSLEQAARASGLSSSLLAALIWQESGWREDALSPRGAIGLAQLMPATAHDLGVDARDPRMNLMAGARYLRALYNRFDGNLERALAAYNAGPARVARSGGVPAITETRGYVAAISARLSTSLHSGK